MTDTKSGTGSALDAMQASIMGRKTAAQTKLTPVGTEKPPGSSATPTRMDDLPTLFMPQEMIEGIVRDIRGNIAALTEWCDKVDAAFGVKPVADAKPDKKLERFAGTDPDVINPPTEEVTETAFDKDFAAKQAAAKAAAFKADDTEDEDPPETKVLGVLWVCPDHGDSTEKLSRIGRKFRACTLYPTGCKQFERLT